MKKVVFLILLIFLIANLTYSLRMGKDRFTHNLQRTLEHKIKMVNLHQNHQGHQEKIPDKVFTELKDYVSNDDDISNRIHAQRPLTKSSADKVKSYFLENEEFKNFTIKNLVSDTSNPHCLDKLSQEGSEKLFNIILDQVDFTTIFLPHMHDQQFSQQQVLEIIFQLKTDKQLCPALEKCFN